MRILSDLKISSKLMSAFGFVLSMMVSIGVFAVVEFSRFEAIADEINTSWLPGVRYAQELEIGASYYRRLEFNHALSNDPVMMAQD